MQVRDAVAADAEAIAQVMIGGMRSVFEGLVPEYLLEWPDSAAGWKKTIVSDLHDGLFLDVAQAENGLVVGFVLGGKTHSALYQGQIKQLNVLPEYQGQGIGRLLVRHAAGRLAAEGINSLCVRVLKMNPNRGFYERLGGEFVSEQPYDWDGEIFSEYLYGWKDTKKLVESNE